MFSIALSKHIRQIKKNKLIRDSQILHKIFPNMPFREMIPTDYVKVRQPFSLPLTQDPGTTDPTHLVATSSPCLLPSTEGWVFVGRQLDKFSKTSSPTGFFFLLASGLGFRFLYSPAI